MQNARIMFFMGLEYSGMMEKDRYSFDSFLTQRRQKCDIP